MVRCFTAIDANEEARNSLSKLLSEIKATEVEAKLVEPHNLHFTLVFLGELSESAVQGKIRSLQKLAFAPFELELKGLGFFPSSQRINTVWAGCGQGSEQLKVLHEQVSTLLQFREDRPFTPHLALARVKSAKNLDSLRSLATRYAEQSWVRFRVGEVKFKKSTLSPEGPVYEDLASVPLKN